MALPIPGSPKPWEHRPSMDVEQGQHIDGEKIGGIVASCTCGDFVRKFPLGVDPNDVLDGITPHMESHPLPPQSVAALGDESVVLVMAVPGPEGNPVHMSIVVSKEVFDDGKRLGNHLGTIGSPLHFQISEQRERIHNSMKSMGFSSIPMPQGVNSIERVVEMLRGLGHDVNRIGHINTDGSVDYESYPEFPRPEQMTGFLNNDAELTNDTSGGGER